MTLLDRDSCADRGVDLSHRAGGLRLDWLVMVLRQRLRMALIVLSLNRERLVVVLWLRRAGVLKSFKTGLVLSHDNTVPNVRFLIEKVLKLIN